jgi:hypothetical protein
VIRDQQRFVVTVDSIDLMASSVTRTVLKTVCLSVFTDYKVNRCAE